MNHSARAHAPATQPKFNIQLRDLPDSFLTSAQQAIKNFVVGFVFKGAFIGSGTLITWGRHHGILTAEHVTNNPESAKLRVSFSSSNTDELQLMVADFPHYLGFEVRYLQNFTLGKRTSERFGPDLSVIQLPPSSTLNTIKAKKSFWSLTVRTEQKLAAALVKNGCDMIAGHVGAELEEQGARSGFKEVCFIPGLVAATGRLRYFERRTYDYIDVGSIRTLETDAPISYGGISGGSLWRVPILRKKGDDNTKVYFRDFFLSGVPFYESDEDSNGRRRIRAHGPKSIYQKLLPTLPR